MSRGWIPAWRKLFDPDHPLAPSKIAPASKIHAWLDLCQMATHQDHKHRDYHLERGQVMVAVRTLAKRWGWSKSRVSRFVGELEARTQIGTVSGTPHGTIYQIVNYDTYAVLDEGGRDTQRDDERDRSGTGAGQEQQQNHITRTTDRPAKKKKTRLPDSWEPNPEHEQRAKDAGLDLSREADKFRAHATEKGRTALVWNAAFTRWLMNAEEYQQPSPNGNGKPNGSPYKRVAF